MAANARACPVGKPGRPQIARASGDAAMVAAAAAIPPPRRPERELAAWGAAVAHLHGCGLPAAVPQFASRWLRRRGVRPDWEAAA